MLPNADLKPAYDKVTWMYVYRDFSGSAADKAAERVSIRCGVTAWPNHLLMDPKTLEIVGDTGRSVDSFLKAVDAAKVGKGAEGLEAWKGAEARALELDAKPGAALAAKRLADEDIVVRTLALRYAVKHTPGEIAARARELLAVPNDPFRYEVCDALAASPRPEAARALEAVLAEPGQSRNPNVLRMKSAAALAACGDAASVDALAPFAKGAVNNGLTGACVDAIVSIARRAKDAKEPARKALASSFPEPAVEDRMKKMVEPLAKRVHAALEEVTGRKMKFPSPYDAEARAELSSAWGK